VLGRDREREKRIVLGLEAEGTVVAGALEGGKRRSRVARVLERSRRVDAEPRRTGHAHAACARTISSSTSRRRSFPKYISSPTKNAGRPKTPRATARSVSRDQLLLDVGVLGAREQRAPSSPDAIERRRDDGGVVHLLRLGPHVPHDRLLVRRQASVHLAATAPRMISSVFTGKNGFSSNS
jgi:hypothetical protein